MSASPADTSPAHSSLLAVRLAAAVGVLLAIAAVVFAFGVNVWVGAVVAFFSPVVPMASVMAVEAIRR